MPTPEDRRYPPYPLRMSPTLRRAIQQRAALHRRSMQQEILLTLEREFTICDQLAEHGATRHDAS